MTSIVTVSEEWHGELPVARVTGEVDASNVDEVGYRLRALPSNRATGLVVDLTATTYLDSAGINVLFAIGEEMAARQQTLRLVVALPSPIARMLGITSLDRMYPTHPTVAEALAAADAR